MVDGRMGSALRAGDYQGHAVGTGQTNRARNWRPAVNEALARMIREVATDPRLVAALGTP